MKTIWKTPFCITDLQDIEVPVGIQILCVQMQGMMPCLWYSFVMPEDRIVKMSKRRLRVIGTGQHFEQRGPYIGTIQIPNQELVFHIFEEH